MALLWIVLGAALVVATAIFHSMNPLAVNLNLFGYPIFGVPLWMLVAIPAAVGLALGLLLSLPDQLRAAWRNRRLTGILRDRDRDIAALRQRGIDLERDLAAARAAYTAAEATQTPVVIEETRTVPAADTITKTRTEETRTALPRAA